MIQAHKIDVDGFVVEPIVIKLEQEVSKDIIKEPMQNGLYKPKWTGTEWIEGKTEEEFLEDEFLASLQPSPKEVAKAERELEIIELLIEMEVV